MSILVINSGSTSLKASILDPLTGRRLAHLVAERIGTSEATFRLNQGQLELWPGSHADMMAHTLPQLLESVSARAHSGHAITSVGHRVVHGGDVFRKPTLVDESVIQKLREMESLAPLHNPSNLAGIQVARELLPNLPHVAVFDTAFHGTLPRRARTYALPQDLAERHSLRRFGFHGTSHQYVAERAADFLKSELHQLRLITCHLGGGCSVCAVEYGRSVETSMGMTPLEGLVMGSRSGDLDPAVLMHLAREAGMSIDEIDALLNKHSGLAGLSGCGSDLRDIEAKAEQGDERCRLAIQVFCHRLRKYIGAYAAVMGGVDAIVFTAGIGQHSCVVRHRALQRLEFLGAILDEDRNRTVQVSEEEPVVSISPSHSRVRLLVARTDEAAQIAKQTHRVCETLQLKSATQKRIPVAISARHVHLTQETVELLFGRGHTLTPWKPLSQPGQFAAQEQVTIVGPKRSIERVRVLGPTRSKNQVEISRTDEFFLGVDAPIRASGDVENTPGVTLLGTDERRVTLDRGVICAWRHIHMTPEDAKEFGVQDRDVVQVEVGEPGVRSLTFGDVLVRVKPSYALEMHIDTDEGNAAELDRLDQGRLEQDSLQVVGQARNIQKT